MEISSADLLLYERLQAGIGKQEVILFIACRKVGFLLHELKTVVDKLNYNLQNNFRVNLT